MPPSDITDTLEWSTFALSLFDDSGRQILLDKKRSNLEQEQRNRAFDSPNDLMTQLMKREVMRLLAEESDCQRPHMKLFLVIDRIEGKVDEESPDELLLF